MTEEETPDVPPSLVSRARAILEKHRRHRNPITASALARRLRLKDGEASPRIRSVIRAVVQSGLPIGAGRRGFFVITDETELDTYLHEREERACEILENSEDIEWAYADYYRASRGGKRGPR